VEQAGAAGGALQTAQRIGSAIGTAVLAAIFYQVLVRTGRDYRVAVYDALLCASGVMLLALLMAVVELVRRHQTDRRAALPLPEHAAHRV
jgi:4-amino-4-deoxy-L-arabinose transferase-like glycosyltransferase